MKRIPRFDVHKCTLCGRCVAICPRRVLSISAEGAVTSSVDECMLCSHCYAVCPAGAVGFDPAHLVEPRFTTFKYRAEVIPPAGINAALLVNAVRSRRSVRSFKDKIVSDATLRDLVTFAATAPSGSNCQAWHFLVLNGREKVLALGKRIERFFIRLNRTAANPIIRYLSVLFVGRALLRYRRDHMESVAMGLREAAKGKDPLFHGAPALIIAHGPLEGSTPPEDAQYATYHIALLAHALGLGTCYIGYAVEAINRNASIKSFLSIPSDHRVFAVLAIGYPDVKYYKLALRKPVPIRFL